ncbi:hypothetical protein [Arsenophonus sp. PmNCSU2021_1]|uniref:hypothetical protein n=1 Tax=Arsenophonus sp. PmNCSU2021_1 TaxID=3118989 RepID=UPI002FF350E3
MLISSVCHGYTKNNFYTIDSNGWVVKSTPVGEVFVCSDCSDLVQVQISYGNEAGNNTPFHNDKQFVEAFDTPEKKKQFANMLLEGAMPSENYDLDIIAVGDDHIGGLKAIRYSAIIKMSRDMLTRETTLITMHKNRIVKFSANFYENKLSGKSAILLEKLSNSLKFL